MDFRIYIIVCEEPAEDLRIGCSHTFPVEIFQSGISLALWNRERNPASSESQFLEHIHLQTFFSDLVKTDYSDISSSDCHSLRNIIIAQEDDFRREIRSPHQELTLFLTHSHTGLLQKVHTLFIQTSLGLNRNPQHYIFFHILALNKKARFRGSRPYKHTYTPL